MKKRQIKRKFGKIQSVQIKHLVNNHVWAFVWWPGHEREHGIKPYPFTDEDERRALYFQHRDKLWQYQGQGDSFGIAGFNYGDRPHAYWLYELGIDPDTMTAKDRYLYLKKHKLLRPGEEDKMFAEMRKEKAEEERLSSK